MTTSDDQDPTTSGLPSYGSMPPSPPEGSVPPPPPPGVPAPTPSPSGFHASDAIGYGWRKFQQNVGQILLAILALIVFTVVVEVVAGLVTGSGFNEDADDFSIGGSLFRIITLTGGFIAAAFVIRGALDITEGNRFDIVTAFKQLDIVNVILTSLLVAVITSIGYALLWIPGIVAQFLLLFAVYYAVDKRTNAIGSVKSSFNLVKDNIGATITLILLSIVAVIAGLIALCVGVFVALPVVAIAWAYAYKTLLGEPVAP